MFKDFIDLSILKNAQPGFISQSVLFQFSLLYYSHYPSLDNHSETRACTDEFSPPKGLANAYLQLPVMWKKRFLAFHIFIYSLFIQLQQAVRHQAPLESLMDAQMSSHHLKV